MLIMIRLNIKYIKHTNFEKSNTMHNVVCTAKKENKCFIIFTSEKHHLEVIGYFLSGSWPLIRTLCLERHGRLSTLK